MIHGNYNSTAFTTYYLPEKQVETDEGIESHRIKVTISYLYLEHIKTKYIMRFTVTKRKGQLLYNDNRDHQSMSRERFVSELTRMVGVKGVYDIFDAWKAPAIKSNVMKQMYSTLLERYERQ